MESPAPWIALLRAIGPATHSRMSMHQLRAGCEAAGFSEVRTVLATGNVLLRSDRDEAAVADALRGVIEAHGLSNAVFLRRPVDLGAILAAAPFPDAAHARPDHLLVLFMATPPDASQAAAARAHRGPERVAVAGREAFIDFVEGVGRSKLTAAKLERLLGRPGTARNWNTVRRLREAWS